MEANEGTPALRLPKKKNYNKNKYKNKNKEEDPDTEQDKDADKDSDKKKDRNKNKNNYRKPKCVWHLMRNEGVPQMDTPKKISFLNLETSYITKCSLAMLLHEGMRPFAAEILYGYLHGADALNNALLTFALEELSVGLPPAALAFPMVPQKPFNAAFIDRAPIPMEITTPEQLYSYAPQPEIEELPKGKQGCEGIDNEVKVNREKNTKKGKVKGERTIVKEKEEDEDVKEEEVGVEKERKEICVEEKEEGAVAEEKEEEKIDEKDDDADEEKNASFDEKAEEERIQDDVVQEHDVKDKDDCGMKEKEEDVKEKEKEGLGKEVESTEVRPRFTRVYPDYTHHILESSVPICDLDTLPNMPPGFSFQLAQPQGCQYATLPSSHPYIGDIGTQQHSQPFHPQASQPYHYATPGATYFLPPGHQLGQFSPFPQ